MKRLLIMLVAAAMLTGCGKEYKSKRAVKAFLSENLTSDDYSRKFRGFDSTINVTPSAINRMHADADKMSQFKKGIQYAPTDNRRAMMFQKVQLKSKTDTLQLTFYLDNEGGNVVAFKQN